MPHAPSFAERTRILLEHPALFAQSAAALSSAAVLVQINEALDRGETHYTDRPGILPLRQKIAFSLANRFAISTDAKNDIIVTCGVTEARFVAIQQLLQPDQTIAVPTSSDRIFGAALLRRVLLQEDVTHNTDVLYLTSSMPEKQLRSSLAATSPACLIVFEVDEPKNHFHPSQIAGFENRTVTIGQLGDDSWRVGYLASPASFSPALRDFKQALTICSTSLSQWAALAFEDQS